MATQGLSAILTPALAISQSFTPMDCALEGLKDEVQNTLDAFIQAPDSLTRLEIEAAWQTSLAIQNAQNAYRAYPHLKTDKGSEAQNTLAQFEEMVEDLQSKNEKKLIELITKVQRFLDQPLCKSLAARVKNIGTRFPSFNYQQMTTLTVEGIFPSSKQPHSDYVLTFNKHRFELISSSTQSLTFKGPYSAIFSDNSNGSIQAYSYAVGTVKLVADYSLCRGWFGQNLKTHEYEFIVGKFPSSPGKITAIYSSNKKGEFIKEHFISSTQLEKMNPSVPSNPSDWVIKQYKFQPSPGYRVLLSTPKVIVELAAIGNYQLLVTSINEDEVVVQVKLDAQIKNDSRILKWHVEFDEIKPLPEENLRQVPIDLRWEDSFEIANRNPDKLRLVKIVFNAFDGNEMVFEPISDFSKKYLLLLHVGANFQIQTWDEDKISNHLNSQNKG